jgi:hypothetical protein
LGRIERFVLDEQLGDSERFAKPPSAEQRCPAFTEGDDVLLASDGKQLTITPQIAPPGEQLLRSQEFGDAPQIISHEQWLAAFDAEILQTSRIVLAPAIGALEVLYVHRIFVDGVARIVERAVTLRKVT